jgi:hypothetical protein
MKKSWLMTAIGVCWLASPLSAQERIDLATIARIKKEGQQRSQVLATFNTLTNVIGPRLTGSPGHKTSADWTRKQLETWGVSNAHLEPFEFGRGWSPEKLTLELTAPRYFPLFGYPEAWTPGIAEVLEKPPVYVGDKTIDEVKALGERIRGAIVLLQPPQTQFIKEDRLQPSTREERVRIGAPPTLRNDGKAPTADMNAALQELGAGLVLRPNMGEHGTSFVLGRRNTADTAVPSIILNAEHYNMIARLVQSGANPTVRAELRVRYHDQDRNTYNVIAEIPGTDPRVKDEIVLLGAHLDSWHSSTGATDNADGVASAMEAMRILQALNLRPRRTIRLALWSGEEEGLLGSAAYATKYLRRAGERANRDKFYLYLNDDPGTGPIYGWYMQENAALKASSMPG